MKYEAINFKKKFTLFNDLWQQKVVAQMNNYQFKIAKIKGDFIWHKHDNTDETFIVLDGKMRIDFRGGSVSLASGEMFVVPKGMEHKPHAEYEARIMVIEPNGVINTGNDVTDRTAENDVWI